MAHVVARQRGSFLYPLILFIFLFLLSTTLAILFYTRQDEKSQALTAARRKNTILIKKNRKNEQIIERLVMKIAGQNIGDDAAIKQADDVLSQPYAQEYANLGLAPAVKGLDAKLADAQKRIKNLESTVGNLKDEIGKKNDEITRIKQGLLQDLIR